MCVCWYSHPNHATVYTHVGSHTLHHQVLHPTTVLDAGTGHSGRCIHQLSAAGCGPHQSELHHTYVLCLKAASTVFADHEA